MKLTTLTIVPVAAVLVVICICDGMPHGNNGNNNSNEESNGNSGNANRESLKTSDVKKKLKGFSYIKKYMMVDNGKTVVKPAADNLQDGMKMLQKLAGLEETGSIDEPTARAMTWPRCGNTDNVTVQVTEDAERKKRYVLSGGTYKWNKFDLTYKIKNFPNMSVSVITEAEVAEAVAIAFKLWSDVTPLTFTRVPSSSTADIVLLFGKGKHTTVTGDPPFDGQGGTLAHAFTPNSGWGTLNGDVHYDDDETFTHKKYFGRNLQYVTAHEVGHALGLDHSNTQGALMWPFILGYTANYQLPEDDKLGIQAIYGENPNPPAEEPTEPPPPATTEMPPPVYCNLTFDDVEVIRGQIFAFSGKRFWRFSIDGHLINPVEGTLIRSFFKGVPSIANAVIERWYDEKVLFVKGKKIWQMTSNNADQGYPKLLSDLSIPKMVDTAMHRASEGVTYYFKEKMVYAYDEFEEALTKEGAVKVHKVFKGVPRGTRVTAAFTGLDGYHYLLVGLNYYKVDPNLQSNGDLSNFGQDFLRCSSA